MTGWHLLANLTIGFHMLEIKLLKALTCEP